MTAPTPRHINKAIPCLRQAYEIAIQIEAIDGYADEKTVALHIVHMMRQLRYAASHLGMDMNDVVQVVADNSDSEPNTLRG